MLLQRAFALLIGLAMVVLASALPGAAGAKPATIAATGGGTFGDRDERFSFNVKDLDGDLATDAAKGKFAWKGPPTSFSGKVVCLRVDGQDATFSGTVEKSNARQFVRFRFIVSVSDSGQPGGQGDKIQFRLEAGAPTCANAAAPQLLPIKTGEIIVVEPT